MVKGHQPNTTTHIGTNVNPVKSKRIMFLYQVGLIRRSKAETMAAGGNSGGGNQAAFMPTWNQQANMGNRMAPAMMAP